MRRMLSSWIVACAMMACAVMLWSMVIACELPLVIDSCDAKTVIRIL
jgi:hypothetical protein